MEELKKKLVTTKSAGSNQLYISGTKTRPSISYINENDQVVSVLSSSKTLGRPLLCNEVYLRLVERCWNRADGDRYVTWDDTGNPTGLYYRAEILENTKHLEQLNNIKENQVGTDKAPVGESFIRLSGDSYNVLDTSYIDTEFSNQFGNIGVDILEMQRIKKYLPSRTELIKLNSTTYTNNIDLRGYMRDVSYITALLTIQYSKVYDNGTTYIQSKDITLEVQTGREINNCLQDINEDVQVEYLNGTIQVFPLSNSIVECIIARCTLIYGDL